MSDAAHLIDVFYRTWLLFHPEQAVDLGIYGYSDRLRPYDDDQIAALMVLQEKLINSFDEQPLSEYDEDARIDLELMRGQALLELEALHERDWRERDPGQFLPVYAIYQLLQREVSDLPRAIKERLQAIPNYLRGARTQLQVRPETIPPLWLESAHEEAIQGAAYLRGLRQHPTLMGLHLDALLEDAAHALEDFARYMETDLAPRAAGSFACGRGYFDRVLQYRHRLDINADTLHDFGRRLFDTTRQELEAVTRELSGSGDIAALEARIGQDHPTAEQLLSTYRDTMQSAREFVEAQGLVNMPATESLQVMETPVFLRHKIPFAAYYEPAPQDPRQQGYYYVTPPETSAGLAEHHCVGIAHTSVHEAWPGHHLQFVTANLNSRSRTLPRLLNASATLYEGWALYCEQLMQEQGFLEKPESRFVLLKDRLWRALRVMLDVELHCRDLSLDVAVDRMVRELGFSRSQAKAELAWYTHAPGVPMGYATGWALINASRDRLRTHHAGFSLGDFHNRLLGRGSIGLAEVLRRQFGEPLWASVRDQVFAKS